MLLFFSCCFCSVFFVVLNAKISALNLKTLLEGVLGKVVFDTSNFQ